MSPKSGHFRVPNGTRVWEWGWGEGLPFSLCLLRYKGNAPSVRPFHLGFLSSSFLLTVLCQNLILKHPPLPMEDTFGTFLVDESSSSAAAASAKDPDHGWQKVTYAKRQRRPQNAADLERHRANGLLLAGDRPHVFASVEQKAQERRRALEAEAAAEAGAGAFRSRAAAAPVSDDDDDDSGAEAPHGGPENGEAAKKGKQKKPRKPKVTVQEAAAKIDAVDLGAFLVDVSVRS